MKSKIFNRVLSSFIATVFLFSQTAILAKESDLENKSFNKIFESSTAKYTFTHDKFGKPLQTKIGDQILWTNIYNLESDLPKITKYGNDHRTKYKYNHSGYLTQVDYFTIKMNKLLVSNILTMMAIS